MKWHRALRAPRPRHARRAQQCRQHLHFRRSPRPKQISRHAPHPRRQPAPSLPPLSTTLQTSNNPRSRFCSSSRLIKSARCAVHDFYVHFCVRDNFSVCKYMLCPSLHLHLSPCASTPGYGICSSMLSSRRTACLASCTCVSTRTRGTCTRSIIRASWLRHCRGASR